MSNLKDDVKKYEAELSEISRRLSALDDERNKLVRIGVRVEGALAYINSKLKEEVAPDSAPASEEPAPATAA